MVLSPLPSDIAAAIERERQSPIPDPIDQQVYAQEHGSRDRLGWASESDIQIAVRARMLTRSDIMHEAVCTATRDRICALWMENRRLRAGLKAVQDLIADSGGVYGLHQNGDPAPWDELQTGGRFEDWLLDFDAAVEASA